MHCSEIMLCYVYKCAATDAAGECARLMREAKIGFVPVVDEGGRLVGVVTDRDLVVRLLAAGLPSDTPVGEVMTRGELLTCAPDEEVRAVELRMAGSKRSRAVVVDVERRPVGIISISDIAQQEKAVRTGRLLRAVSRRQAVQIVRR